MLRSAVPPSFPIPFASSAGAGFIRAIPQASQIGITNGAASLTDGFPPLNFTPIAAGGVPPFGEDFNGLMNQVTLWNQWQEAGGPIIYNGTFQTAVGGYANGAIVQSAILPGKLWMSSVDNNMTNPDTLGANWTSPPGVLPTGSPIASFSATVLPNCVLANGQTIGNTGSGGTTGPTGLASATAFFLFVALWTQFPQSTCTTQFNGATVARGANAAADWAAGRVITTPMMQGSALTGADANGTTRLAGVPIIVGTSTTAPGAVVGENLHTLSVSEVPALSYSGSSVTGVENQAHSHLFNQAQPTATGQVTTGGLSGAIQQVSTSTGTESANHNHNFSWSGVTNGGGGSHNNVPLSYLVYWNLAL
jgi:hypothetical protein